MPLASSGMGMPMAQRADTAVLYRGHGSEHQANSAYALMEYAFHDLGRKDVVIGTVEAVQTDDGGLARYAVLEPGCSVDEMKELFIITDFDVIE